MKIEYNITKSETNIKERGISFDLVKYFEIDSAVIEPDNRFDYDEQRFNAIGYIGNIMYNMTYTMRFDIVRVISLRKADKKEIRKYANT